MAEFTGAMHDIIAGYTVAGSSTPLFAKVFKGDPNALTITGGKPLARWQTPGSVNAPEGPRTLVGQRMVEAVFNVACYWPLTASEGAQHSQEDDIADVMIGLPAKLVEMEPHTYTIAGKDVSLVTVETVTVGRAFLHQTSESEYRILTFDVRARVLEAS